MFGYITIASAGLSPERQARYRAHYCGLCHTLGQQFGPLGQMTLSYDFTFLYLLLSSLYEPQEETLRERCVPHPLHRHSAVVNELAAYCCDMNIAVAYHKCLDDWQDDRSLMGKAEAALLARAYGSVQERHPEKCRRIEECLQALSRLEKRADASLDEVVNLSGRLLGVLFRCRQDLWADTLQHIGEGLGRFICLMDAYDDLEADMRRKRFNPLIPLREREDFEELIKESLTLLIAEATDAFETLPLVQDMDILRNILYAGCWTRWEQKKQQRERKSGVAEQKPRAHKEDGA